MKKIASIFLALAFIFALQSCKRMADDDGNLLNNMSPYDGSLGHDRFLHQEVTSADTLAHYVYNGRKLVQVLEDKAVTDIIYTGELINKIIYKGIIGSDSLSYTQEFKYDVYNGNKLYLITENRKQFVDILNNPYPTNVPIETKSEYNITLSTNNKLLMVLNKVGLVDPATTFAFTSYSKTDYTYFGDNVSKAHVSYGGLLGNVLQPTGEYLTYEYLDFDDKINPHTLIPFGYLLHKTFENPFNNYRFSANNPKKITLVDHLVPLPQVFQTQYNYDNFGYAVTGWGIVYDFRPF